MLSLSTQIKSARGPASPVAASKSRGSLEEDQTGLERNVHLVQCSACKGTKIKGLVIVADYRIDYRIINPIRIINRGTRKRRSGYIYAECYV